MDQRQREMDQLAQDLATSRSREVELATELGGLRTRIDELTTGMAARSNEVTAQLEQFRDTANKLAAAERDLARLRTTTTALRDVLLTPNLDGDDLRGRLLAELLDRTG
jgi:chromosome segregation ATPase